MRRCGYNLVAGGIFILFAAVVTGGIKEGERHLENGRYRKAVEAFEAVLKDDPLSETALFNLGYIYGNHLRDESLKEHYWNRYKASSHVSLGDLDAANGRYDEAVASYTAALAITPRDPALHERVAKVFSAMGMEKEAIKEYQKAVALDPENVGLHTVLWERLKAEGLMEEAVTHAEDALRLDPGLSDMRRDLLACYRKKGESDGEIIRHLRILLKKNEATPDERLELAERYIESGALNDAARLLCKAEKSVDATKRFSLAEQLAQEYEKGGKTSRAAAVHEACISAGHRSPEGYNRLIILYHSMDRLDAAVETAEKAVAHFPGSAALYNNLGTLYALKTEYRKAVDSYRKAVALDPGLAGTYLDLGIIYRNYLDDYQKAVEAFRKYVELDPDGKTHPVVAEALRMEPSPVPGNPVKEVTP